MVSSQIVSLGDGFQVLEIVGKQLQNSIPRLPSVFVTCKFVTCKFSFWADKMKYMEVVWALCQLWAAAILKTLRAAFLCIYSSEFLWLFESQLNLLLSASLNFCLRVAKIWSRVYFLNCILRYLPLTAMNNCNKQLFGGHLGLLCYPVPYKNWQSTTHLGWILSVTLTVFNSAWYPWGLQWVLNVSLNKDGFKLVLIVKHAHKHLTDSGPKRDKWRELQSSWYLCLPISAISIHWAGQKGKESEKKKN